MKNVTVMSTRRSGLLLLMLLDGLRLMELGGKMFRKPLAQGLFDELAGLSARRTREATGLHRGFPLGADDDLDGLHMQHLLRPGWST